MKTKILLLAFIACNNILFAQNPLLLKQATNGGTATISQVVNTKTGTAFYNTVDNANPFSGTWGLFHTDGSVAGNKKLTLSDGRYITTEATLLTALDSNRVLFAGDNSQGYGEVWVSDGTQQGTFGLQNFLGGNVPPVQSIGAIGSLGVYAAVSNDGQLRLHVTNGNAYADTAVIYTFPASIASVLYFKTINNILYFEANNSSTLHNEIWRTDGTEPGTYLLKDLGQDYGFASDFMAFNNNIYFITISSSFGDYIWKSDGTTTGTTQLKQISASFNQDNLFPSYAATSTALYFAANDGVNGKEVWTTDGTNAGTHLLQDLFAGSAGSNPSSFAVLNDVLYLSANNGIAGQELFKYDKINGSNVTLVKDIFAGGTGSNPLSIAVNNNSIIFNATQNTTDGAELWISGGDAANTLQVDNIAKPALQSSSPKLITSGTQNFFVGNYDFNNDLSTNEQAVFLYTPPTKIWTGNVSGDPSVADNWFPAGAPSQTSTDDIIIPASAGNNLTNPFLFCHSFYNNGGTVDVGSGLCLITGDFFNEGTINNPYINGFASGVFGIVASGGVTATHFVGSSGIYNGQLTVSSGANIRLSANSYIPVLRVEGADVFYLGEHNLMTDVFAIQVPKIVTDSSGKFLMPVGNSNVLFPVSADSASYSPVTISNSGDYDYFGVNVKNGVFSKGDSGAVITQEAVNKTWNVSEALAGGSNANITFQWNAADELPMFNRNNIYVSHYINGSWDNGLLLAASGNNPYTAITYRCNIILAFYHRLITNSAGT